MATARGWLCVVVCAVVASLAANAARAAEWSFEPSVDLRGEYDDNIHFSSAPHPSVWGVIVSPDAKFAARTETLDVSGGLRINLNRYFGESGLDTTDYILGVRSSYKTERDLYGLNLGAVRDSTLVSELSETGVVLAREQRRSLSANPSWSRALTETTSLGASYTFNDVHYSDTSGTALVNYRDQTATVSVQTKPREGDVASASAYYERYDTAQSRASTWGAQLTYDRLFSETLHASVTAGLRNTRSTIFANALVCDAPIVFGMCSGNVFEITSTASERDTGYLFAAALEKKWEVDSLTAQVSHELNPSGVGALVETDRVGATWARSWSPTVSSTLYAAAYRARTVGDLVQHTESRYFTIEPRVSWRLTQAWTLLAGYRYNHVTYEESSAKASENVAYLVLTYAWPKMAVSR